MKMTKSKQKNETVLRAFLLSTLVSINNINRFINNRSIVASIICVHGRSINNIVQEGSCCSFREKLWAKRIPRKASPHIPFCPRYLFFTVSPKEIPFIRTVLW